MIIGADRVSVRLQFADAANRTTNPSAGALTFLEISANELTCLKKTTTKELLQFRLPGTRAHVREERCQRADRALSLHLWVGIL